MNTTFTILFISVTSFILSSCSMISANYLPSSGIQRLPIAENEVQVFYEKQDVDFKYKEIGRIYLKNINYWADRDPAAQIMKIKKEAANCGADAVIIINEMRKDGSFGFMNGIGGGNSGDVFQYSGIAIIKE